MSGQRKMIIITSDEDIVRQFDLKEDKNTQIIDIDDNKQITSSKTNDHNSINWNFLAELTGLNCKNDQVFKRAIDATDHHQLKPIKSQKKSTDLVCSVCGDRAIGYNYAVLSCASCKAFFHRNGHHDPKRLKCLTGHGRCTIEHKINRKCYRYRLERCLTMGMKKEYILSQEEIQRRKDAGRHRNNSSKRSSTIESTDSQSLLSSCEEIDRILMEIHQDNAKIHGSNEVKSLTTEDLVVVQYVRASFLSIFQNPCEVFNNFTNLSDRTAELIFCLQFNNEVALRVIKFCRLIDEFEHLHVDDRFIMIKYNLMLLFCVLTSYRPTQSNSSLSDAEREAEEEKERHMIYILCNQSNYFYQLILNLSGTFTGIIQQDHAVLSLLLIIFLFSKGSSMNENEPSFKDSLSVYRAQSYYTKLLWNYMIDKQGEMNTCQDFIKLMTAISQAQSTTMKFRQYLSREMTTLDAVDEIAPLMQTILHIS